MAQRTWRQTAEKLYEPTPLAAWRVGRLGRHLPIPEQLRTFKAEEAPRWQGGLSFDGWDRRVWLDWAEPVGERTVLVHSSEWETGYEVVLLAPNVFHVERYTRLPRTIRESHRRGHPARVWAIATAKLAVHTLCGGDAAPTGEEWLRRQLEEVERGLREQSE